MKIVVIGGSGLIGTKLGAILTKQGHEVVAASPSTGVNTITREGLAEALSGAQVVVDVVNAPSWEPKAVLEFFETSSRNILAAETAAGVAHHVALSVVGTERLLESGYFPAKLAQEKLIKESGVPYTILRATQFFEFVGGIVESGHRRRHDQDVAGAVPADRRRRRRRRAGRCCRSPAGQWHDRGRRTRAYPARQDRPAVPVRERRPP